MMKKVISKVFHLWSNFEVFACSSFIFVFQLILKYQSREDVRNTFSDNTQAVIIPLSLHQFRKQYKNVQSHKKIIPLATNWYSSRVLKRNQQQKCLYHDLHPFYSSFTSICINKHYIQWLKFNRQVNTAIYKKCWKTLAVPSRWRIINDTRTLYCPSRVTIGCTANVCLRKAMFSWCLCGKSRHSASALNTNYTVTKC